MTVVKSIFVVLSISLIGLVVFHKDIVSKILVPQYIEWGYEIEAQGLKSGVPLDSEGLMLAKDIGIQSPEKIRIVYVDEIPFPHDNFALKMLGEAVGFIGDNIINEAQAFGYSIYVRKDYEFDKPSLAHEIVHVLQIERANFEDVTFQHLSDLTKYGYDKAPLEVEAFEANKKYGG
tara:strand:- start:16994 stop:17521 length:528 start_codon:yes stop_codon:yes gene_type:complete